MKTLSLNGTSKESIFNAACMGALTLGWPREADPRSELRDLAPELPPHDLGADDWAVINHALDLSPRELQVAQMIRAGVQQKNIAWQLGVRAHTVSTYVGRVYAKA